MRKLLIVLLLLASPAFAQTGTPKDKATLQSEINTNFPDNTTGLITPAIARSTFSDFLASWQQYAKVRAVTGTTDTILATDYGALVTYSNGSAIAVTLPQATGTSFGVFNVMASNLGAGTVTITPTTSTINGTSTLALTTGQAVFIYSDGTNYQVIRSAGSNTPGTVTSATIAAGTGIGVAGTCTITTTGTCTVSNTGVTSVTAGTGLTGGVITTTGTAAVDFATNSNIWGGTASKLIDAAGAQTALAPQAPTIATNTITPALGTGINFDYTLVHATCPCVINNPTGIYAGYSGYLTLIQSSTGSDTVTWDTFYKFQGGTAPTLSTAANAVDTLPIYCRTTTFCEVTIGTAFQ